MKVTDVKEKLSNDTDLLIEILEKFSFHNIRYQNNEIRCGHNEISNPTSVKINTETLSAICFSQNVKGDIYTLLSWKSGMERIDVHNQLTAFIGDGEIFSIAPKKTLFAGIYKKFEEQQTDKVYNRDILSDYEDVGNVRFYEDGICPTTQRKFDIMYDHSGDYIVIVWHDELGNIVGVKGRYNGNHETDFRSKYIALQRFSKTHFLYGLYQNYNEIIRERKVYIFEAEKSVMQLDTMGVHLGVAIGSHDISLQQIKLLKWIANDVILCYDSDVDLDTILSQCQKIKNEIGKLYSGLIKVGFMYDYQGILDKKCSPTDLGKDIFMKMCETIKYV